MSKSIDNAPASAQELQAKAKELYRKLRSFSAPAFAAQECCDAGNALLDVIGRGWTNYEVIPTDPQKLDEWMTMARRVIAEGEEFLRKYSDQPEDLSPSDLSALAARFGKQR